MGKVLVTGAAGFIGFHLSSRLVNEGYNVIGIDNLNNYYDVKLKLSRLSLLKEKANFHFLKSDLKDQNSIFSIFSEEKPKYVVNLAAQAGVRYSIENPHVYIDSNIQGFINVLEACRYNNVEHLLYASSSSVYGANTSMPFSVHDNVDHPISLYAATKKSNELMAHTYSALYGLPTTGLRFFTVYGPWGRPDMALFLFTKAILNGESIDVYNNGEMERDFTYIDDIVEGVFRLISEIPKPNSEWDGSIPDPATSFAPYKLMNIGNNNPIKLMDFIKAIEIAIGLEAQKNFLPLQPGDVTSTYADITDLANSVNFQPIVKIQDGINQFVSWYRNYYSS